METDPKVWIAALRRSHDELAADVASMAPDDLRRRSGCRDWDVSQVLSHLGSGAEIVLANLEANLAGDEPPPNEANQPVWHRWNALEPDARARDYAEWDERVVSQFESLDDATLESLRIALAFLPAPIDVAMAVGLRLSEHALHSWDVRVAFQSEATLPGYVSELLIDRVAMMAAFVGKPDAWRGGPATVGVSTTDPDRRFWFLLDGGVRVDTADSEDNEERPTDGSLTLQAEALLRLTAGRLDQDHTPATVVAEGRPGPDDLRAVFPGY